MGGDTENIHQQFQASSFIRLVDRTKDKNKNKNIQAESDQCKFNPITPSAHMCEHFLTDYNLPLKLIFPAKPIPVF